MCLLDSALAYTYELSKRIDENLILDSSNELFVGIDFRKRSRSHVDMFHRTL